jgi:ferric-dicitrate binding protein FerR (iron transport regulator)
MRRSRARSRPIFSRRRSRRRLRALALGVLVLAFLLGLFAACENRPWQGVQGASAGAGPGDRSVLR